MRVGQIAQKAMITNLSAPIELVAQVRGRPTRHQSGGSNPSQLFPHCFYGAQKIDHEPHSMGVV